jgi:hypothetical protein
MKVKAHLVLPKEILEEVDQIAGKRGRSLFIAEGALEKLERERFLKILEETRGRGAWADKRHPDLRSSRDMEACLGKYRDSFFRRPSRFSKSTGKWLPKPLKLSGPKIERSDLRVGGCHHRRHLFAKQPDVGNL